MPFSDCKNTIKKGIYKTSNNVSFVNTLKQRAAEMVKIAHPNHQEWIEKEYFNLINYI
jgi:hypothetical protein